MKTFKKTGAYYITPPILLRSMVVLLVGFLTACSGSSSTSSEPTGDNNSDAPADANTVNGFYLTKGSFTGVDRIDSVTEDIFYDSSSDYALTNGDNTIELSAFSSGMQTATGISRFNEAGAWISNELFDLEGALLNSSSREYFDNGLLKSIAYTSVGFPEFNARREYSYESGRLISVAIYDNEDFFSELVSYDYDSSGNVVASTSVPQPRGDWQGTNTECEIAYSNGVKSRIECYEYTIAENERRIYLSKDIEHDAAGNRTQMIEKYYQVEDISDFVENSFPPGTESSTYTTVYEYAQTDRTVPNISLSRDKYFPDQ